MKKEQSHVMVTLKGQFKGENGKKWHMLPLVHINESGIEVSILVGRWIEVLVGEEIQSEGWVFHREEVDSIGIQDLE